MSSVIKVEVWFTSRQIYLLTLALQTELDSLDKPNTTNEEQARRDELDALLNQLYDLGRGIRQREKGLLKIK